MSWDVSIVDGQGYEIEHVRNVTYNNSQIFQAIGCYYKEASTNCWVWVELCNQGIKELQANRLKYTHLEPDNKWGGINDTIDFLTQLREKCQMHHDLYVEWR